MKYSGIYNKAHKVSNKISMMFRGKQNEVNDLINEIKKEYNRKKKTINVLDLGCDEGRLTKKIKEELGNRINIFGVDINKDAIRKAKENSSGVIFDVISDDFKKKYKNSFHFIYSSHVFEHVYNRESLSNDIKGLSKDDGVISIIIPQERFRGDLQLIHILFNIFTGVFENPHIVKLDKKDIEKLFPEYRVGKYIYTNLLPEYTTEKRRFDSIGLSVYFNKKK